MEKTFILQLLTKNGASHNSLRRSYRCLRQWRDENLWLNKPNTDVLIASFNNGLGTAGR